MRRIRSLSLVALALTLAVPPVVAVAAPASSPTPAAAAAPMTPAATVAAAADGSQVLASGLSIPWGIATLADGGALFTERDSGKIWRVKPGSAARVVYTVTETRPSGEGGLLGITLAPDFARSQAFYIYYSTENDNRVARVILGSSARPKPIVTGIPRAGNHNGGGLVYKPGGYLYIGTGDAGDRSLSQNTKSLGGKILKVDGTGRAAPGNRWGRAFTMGHRNVQDMVFDPGGHNLWATELGQDTQDELNRIVNGHNYGWPHCEGRCAGYSNPQLTWSPSVASPSGITWVTTPSGPRFFVAALRGQRLWRIAISDTKVTSYTARLVGTYGRIRGVQGRGDGSLWIMTSNGSGQDRVIRLPQAP